MEKYFFEAFKNMDRLGPGMTECTIEAISHIEKSKPVSILDIGCGIGTHTFILESELENAQIVAIDNNEDYISKLNNTVKQKGLTNRVKGICMSMFEMTFEDKSFDYIFAEGAIYIAGFTNGLADWKRLLKKDGMLICSEISWIVDKPSEKPKAFWEEVYPQIDSIANKIHQAEELKYKEIGYFILPIVAWTDNYYVPLSRNLEKMKEKYVTNTEALEVISIIQQEIDLYYEFDNEYSYVFYVLQVKSSH